MTLILRTLRKFLLKCQMLSKIAKKSSLIATKTLCLSYKTTQKPSRQLIAAVCQMSELFLKNQGKARFARRTHPKKIHVHVTFFWRYHTEK